MTNQTNNRPGQGNQQQGGGGQHGNQQDRDRQQQQQGDPNRRKDQPMPNEPGRPGHGRDDEDRGKGDR